MSDDAIPSVPKDAPAEKAGPDVIAVLDGRDLTKAEALEWLEGQRKRASRLYRSGAPDMMRGAHDQMECCEKLAERLKHSAPGQRKGPLDLRAEIGKMRDAMLAADAAEE